MPNILLTFNGPDKEFKAVDPGVYNALVQTEKTELRKKGDTPYINVAFKIVGGEFDDRLVFKNYFLTDEAVKFLRKALRALGEDVPDEGQVPFNTDKIHNKPCRIKVTHSKELDAKGQPYVNVDEVLPPEGGSSSGSGFGSF
jgi:hypothetical protein